MSNSSNERMELEKKIEEYRAALKMMETEDARVSSRPNCKAKQEYKAKTAPIIEQTKQALEMLEKWLRIMDMDW